MTRRDERVVEDYIRRAPEHCPVLTPEAAIEDEWVYETQKGYAARWTDPPSGSFAGGVAQEHQAFLAEVAGKPLHTEIIEWFKTLPLWLDMGGIRVVHACWNDDYRRKASFLRR